jgi:hypothetical protein
VARNSQTTMTSSMGTSMKPEPPQDPSSAPETGQLATVSVDPTQLLAAMSSAPLIAYFASSQGHEVITRLLSMLENLKKASIDTTLDQEKRKLEFHHATWRFWMWAQIGLVLSAIGTAGLLAWHGKLDAGVGTLIGTLVGYVFGKSKG